MHTSVEIFALNFLPFREVGIYDRVVVQEIIKQMAQMHQIDSTTQRNFKGAINIWILNIIYTIIKFSLLHQAAHIYPTVTIIMHIRVLNFTLHQAGDCTGASGQPYFVMLMYQSFWC